MFLTVTPNPALDRTLFIDRWKPGELNPVRKEIESIGGKGLDASVALRHLGQETVALYLAAGPVGQKMLSLVQGRGILPEPIWTDGETRTAFVVAEEQSQQHTHLLCGNLILQPYHIDLFLKRYRELVPRAQWILTGGMLAPGLPDTLLASLVETAKSVGVPILVDGTGAPFLACLSRRPAILKMNRSEFGATFGLGGRDQVALVGAAKSVFEEYRLESLIVTSGRDGILGFTPEGNWHVAAPPQPVVNDTGAGDVASATLTWRLAEGDHWPDALRWTAAASAASVLTEGTADFEMSKVSNILPEVVVSSLS